METVELSREQSARMAELAEVPRSRGRAQDTAGAQAQRADHSHPAARPHDRGHDGGQAQAGRRRPSANC